MLKRRREHAPAGQRPFKSAKRVPSVPNPFGFPLRSFLDNICAPTSLGKTSHNIQNYITRFEHGQPVFHIPEHVYTVQHVDGMYAKLAGRKEPRMISKLHTSYTVRLYHEAHAILTLLRRQQRVQLVHANTDKFKVVDIRTAAYNRRQHVKNVVYLNALHMNQPVVLKTTSDPHTMLKYVLEAVIHYSLKQRAPGCVPKLHFVGMTDSRRLVVCSEQLRVPSVCTWANSLQRPDNSRALYFMLKNVCNAFSVIQRHARFTHRDAHTSNVYYNEKTRQVQFIDFDWSCIWSGRQIVSVPRFLYDTTRAAYGRNRSVDVCIFMRCLGNQIKQAPAFVNRIWLPLMRRYEKESGELLLKKAAGYEGVSGEIAAMQLYKMCVHKEKRSKYSHKNGYRKYGKEFDYIMGYYEWPCMTPQSVLEFLKENDITRY